MRLRLLFNMGLTVVLLTSLLGCGQERPDFPVASDGILDLSGWDFEASGTVDLSGEWRFAWNQFVEPAPTTLLREAHTDTVMVPSIWPNARPGRPETERLPTVGYGTYLLEIILPDSVPSDRFSLKVRSSTSATHWAIYGEEADTRLGYFQQGRPGASRDESLAVWTAGVADVGLAQGNRIVLIVHASNFRHARGGLENAPSLGLREDLTRDYTSGRLWDAGILGVLLIIGVYHFVLFGQRREDKAAFYFGCLCLAIAIRHATTALLLQAVGIGWEPESYRIMLAWEYSSISLNAMAGGLFLHALVPGKALMHFVRIWCWGLGVILLLIAWLTDPLFFTAQVNLYIVHLVIFFGGALAHLSWAVLKRRDRVAVKVLGAFLVIFVGMANDSLHVSWVIRTGYIVQYCFIVFILLQSSIISGTFSWAFKRLKKLSDELSAALERAQSADRLKGEILANLSHELRTPLNALVNVPKALARNLHVSVVWSCSACNQLFEDDGEGQPDDVIACPECGGSLCRISQLNTNTDPHEMIDLLTRTADSGELLNKTLSDMMEFSKLQSATRELTYRQIDCAELIGQVFERFADQATSKNVALVGELSGDHCLCFAEPNHLDLFLCKLIENAVEFAPPGSSIVVRAENIENNTKVRLSVLDEGPGIAAHNHRIIFESFRQIYGGHTRSHGGIGLGLSICSEIAKAHDSEVQLESTLGEGATFSLELMAAPTVQVS
ncbi:MAG: sensor histidine kinase [Myxococcota bacterium]|nr:sensor histidine kinase [Myxococcota bacterium]